MTLTRSFIRVAILVAASFIIPGMSGVGESVAQTGDPNFEYYYHLRPEPAADRTELDITFKFECDTPLVVGLPTDYYGTPDIDKYVTVFEGTLGTTVNDGTKSSEKLIHPNDQGVVTIHYVISYDPIEMDQYSFGPIPSREEIEEMVNNATAFCSRMERLVGAIDEGK